MIVNKLIKLFKEIKPKNKKVINESSFSSLLIKQNITPSQSESIRIGILLEKIFTLYIEKNTNFKNIKEVNKKGRREKDVLFEDCDAKVIIYGEIKSNLELDSEKYKITCTKVLKNEEELKKKYKNKYNIKAFLVGIKYLKFIDMENRIKWKYKELENKVLGINEFLDLFNLDGFSDIEEYGKFLKELYNYYFKN